MAWFDTNWLNRKKITIDNTKVGADETGFPVLIKRTDTDFSSARSDGFDFVFTLADGVTELPYEREVWVDGTGELIAWVKVDILDSTDVDIYIYYNNASQATDKADPENVWDDNYVMVQHLQSTSNLLDSTQYDNDGTNNGTTNGTGQIGGALTFDGVDDYVGIVKGDELKFSPSSTFTMSAWIKASDNPDDYSRIIDFHDTTVGGYSMHLWIGTNGLSCFVEDDTHDNDVGLSGTSINLSLDTMYYVSGVYNGSSWTLYVDGIDRNADTSNYIDGTANLLNEFRIGKRDPQPLQIPAQDDRPWEGEIDEVRISDIVRTPAWILTEYNNQNSPSTFVSFDLQETEPIIKNDTSTVGLVESSKSMVAPIPTPEIASMRTEAQKGTNGSGVYDGSLRAENNKEGGENIVKVINETVGITEASDKFTGFIQEVNEIVGLTELNNKVHTFVKNIPETVGITEASNRLGGLVRNFTDTVGITENFNRLRGMVRNFTDTIGITEVNNRLKTIGAKVLNEVVGLTEASNRLVGLVKNFTDTLGITEASNRLGGLIRNFVETIEITESFNRLRSMVRNFTDVIGITESNNRLRNLLRNFVENISIIESSNRFMVIGAKIINDIIGITEVNNRLRNQVRNFVETIGITENFNRLRNMVRVFTDTIGITESNNRLRNLIRNLVDPIVTVEEVINRIQVFIEYIASMRTETRKGEVSLGRFQDGGMRTEQMKFAPGFIEIINDVIGITEVFNRLRNQVRVFIDTVDIVEASNLGLRKTINDVVQITEVFNRLRNQVRVFIETVGITESFNRLRGLVRNFSETVGIVESFNRLRNQVRVFTDTIGITEQFNRLRSMVRNFSDTVGIVEQFNRLRNQVRTINETVGIVEAFNRLRNQVRNINETVGIVEAFNRLRNQVRNFSETVGVIELSNLGLRKTINDVLEITENFNRLRSMVRVLTDTVGIVESFNRLRNQVRVLNETVGIIETFNRLRNQVRNFIETVGIVEASNLGLRKTISDLVGIVETSNRLGTIIRNLTDTVGITEVFNRLRNQVRTFTETVAIVEASQNVKGVLKIINDTLQITEVFNRVIDLIKVSNDTVGIVEDAFRPTYHLAGVTRDKAQVRLPFCRCTLMKHDGGAEAVRLYTIVANVNSDGNGDFDFTGLIDDQDRYLVKAFDDQIENARGVSNEDLEPILE